MNQVQQMAKQVAAVRDYLELLEEGEGGLVESHTQQAHLMMLLDEITSLAILVEDAAGGRRASRLDDRDIQAVADRWLSVDE
jgi:hypothetical protein